MCRLNELRVHGQSLWLDYIKRSLLASGERGRPIVDGLLGLTSNPSIFEKAIADTSEYEVDLRKLARSS
jgi:transaldolase/glucose-6-phosphate isomerase